MRREGPVAVAQEHADGVVALVRGDDVGVTITIEIGRCVAIEIGHGRPATAMDTGSDPVGYEVAAPKLPPPPFKSTQTSLSDGVGRDDVQKAIAMSGLRA